MRELQKAIVEEMGVKPQINPDEEVSRRVDFLVDYAKAAGAKGFVLGISGGVDSTLAGYLSQKATEKLREEGVDARFYAMRLPHGIQHDEDDAQTALTFIEPDHTFTFNIEKAVTGVDVAYQEGFGGRLADYHRGNVKARLRMTAQYAVAGEKNALVVGTDHGAESITGFFTKYGDGGADILPNFTLNKRQIRQILKHLGASEHIWSKAPTADLLDENPGQLDEVELGITYDQIDDYLEGREVDDDAAAQLEQRYLSTRHKRTIPVTLLDDWWRQG
ncbi:ammonia-dependent NAD(+) synthetase [Nesterenkonia sp. MY13]|uniref:NH(3)-dependent NAD(+) synthetase n=1 Tax=Nesterenkonia sedimenti TaxID=1463632 RepID=A0A7X8TIQ8_9MICC|nr:ammonia-dependent NAD(+) synthetase [Nesterenkonia sedimenti]NLS09434.1 ammonia-dependent NAD(+) synthetase [Nesterenkonia sedimenti]